MRKKEKYKMIFVIADRWNKKLMVPHYVMGYTHELCSPEAGLLNEYLNKYPGFQIEVFACDPIGFDTIPAHLM